MSSQPLDDLTSDCGCRERLTSTPIRDLSIVYSDENAQDQEENSGFENRSESVINTTTSTNTVDQDNSLPSEYLCDGGAFFGVEEQAESRDGSSKFTKFKELNDCFLRRPTQKGSPKVYCKFCHTWSITTTNSDRLVNHAKRCKNFDEDVRKSVILEYNQVTNMDYNDRNNKLNLLWAKTMAANNFSFRSLESKTFKDFVATAISGWRVDDRHIFSSKHITKLGNLADQQFMNKLKNMPRHSISAEFDHWLDSTKRSLFGFILTFMDGSRHIVSLEDVSQEGKTAEVIVEGISRSFRAILPIAVNSITSDSDAACKKAREMIVETAEYQHIIQHRCVAHLLNRMGETFTNKAVIVDTINWAETVSGFCSSDPKIRAKIKEAGNKRVVKGCSTRWYANADMLDSLVANEAVIVEEVTANTSAKDSQKRINLIKKEEHWEKIRFASKLMRPIADCIEVAERKTGSLGEALKSILELGRSLFNLDWDNSLNIAAVESYLTYISTKKLSCEEFGLFLAAYVLDRRYNLDYITKDGIDLAFGAVILVAIKTDVTREKMEQSLLHEYNNYVLWKGKYGRPARKNETAIDWWSSLRDRGVFEEVAIRIARLRSSSANIERTFSILKLIQGHSRTNFNIETLVNLAKVRVAEDDCLHDYLDLSIRNELDEGSSIIDQSFSSSQLSTICESSFCSQSLSPEDEDDPTTRSHLGALRSRDSRELYRKLSQYIDFNRVNSTANTDESVTVEVEEIHVAELVRKARVLRERPQEEL